MAQELAAFYNPGAEDPVGALTIPELLAVVELASHDMAELVDNYVPGGHLLTVNDLRLARKPPDWYQSATNVYWLISALFNPGRDGPALRRLAGRPVAAVPDAAQEPAPLVLHRLRPPPRHLPRGAEQRPAAHRRAALPRAVAAAVADRRPAAAPAAPAGGPGRGGPPRDDHADGPGEGGQVERGQRAARRAAGEDRRAAGDGAR